MYIPDEPSAAEQTSLHKRTQIGVAGVSSKSFKFGEYNGLQQFNVFAIGNFDPFSKAFVLSRGIVGDKGGVAKIASPIFKQSFDLRTGRCLDDPSVAVPVWPARVRDGRVEVAFS